MTDCQEITVVKTEIENMNQSMINNNEEKIH